ncbi:type VI secretion system membrane subunit TssM [Xinfangfangia sp. CPCC 101601]|uniref:Type VI secretion system membrane subunit TssM n=1 Tax=Pseudogemmobacter lacusdianii TaxID=3069608 RepID=A0ABU0VVG3_9RHOB|nr:type VI secretion system membrane subunit TssM [Xinfangfangia sp. CPCC 101601]MDQ2065699.1 type VI secretion system membrane subunit TssM [Xinfangfangia sp. CPCC 101601]
MRFIKSLFRFLISRKLWTCIGVVVLCALIWQFGPLLAFGDLHPLDATLNRLIAIGLVVILWLFSILLGQLRAARKNRMFVTDLTAPPPVAAARPGDANLAAIQTKFAEVLDQMKKSRLGAKKFLREMPWYVIIGPPGTGKTTALKQSGLHFPIDLSDDIKGVGGTRNCDWFFTDTAVLVDTAGRYVEQASDPEIDAAEWGGFLDLLKKHRGKRALNGVIVTLSLQELLGDEAALRAHGKTIRKRLAELRERLQIQLPVYVMLTKVDLVPGFEAFFADLTSAEREQVWGATLPTDVRPEGTVIARELRGLLSRLESRLSARMAEDASQNWRAEVFRFPAQIESLEASLRILIETVFGESRYEEAPWLRGFYFTSAAQEGSPIDRMLSDMAGAYGLRAEANPRRAAAEARSYFLHDLLAGVIFPEAGLGQFDRGAEERRLWIWRGSVAAAALAVTLAGLGFLYSYLNQSGLIADQSRLTADLSQRLANVASRQAPTDPLDLDVALQAMTEIEAAQSPGAASVLALVGPSARQDLDRAQKIAFEHGLKTILEPRMVALLEATMWREIRNPEYLLGALKSYLMLTGQAPYDRDFLSFWWAEVLPSHAPIPPFPTEAALAHQLAALDRAGGDEASERIAPDAALIAQSLEAICTVPLSVRAYNSLMQDGAVTGLPEWIAADVAGPNAAKVLTRLSGKPLRSGVPGAFTYAGFHHTILPLIPEIAAQAALDRAVFTGGCAESSDTSVTALERDILKLYSDDFIAQWDGFLRDIRLASITDLTAATENLKDLASPDSTLKRLLRAVVAETDLMAVPEEAEASADTDGLVKAATKRLGKLGSLISKADKTADKIGVGGTPAEPADPPGQSIATHFAALKSTIQEVDGVPPRLADAEAALGALANELQTVSASPDPEAALLARGGLPQLTGQLTNVAKILPDPVDDWLTGLAGDTISVTRDAVVAQLNARWKADVLPFCTSATAGRYPFETSSVIDVNTADFQRLFGPSGLIDSFTNTHLLAYVDTTVRPWAWRADFGLSAEGLQPFEKARSIRDALFPGGAGPIMSFTLEPTDLSANAARVTLNVDGHELVYFNSATRPVAMTWPGKDGTNLISLSFAPVDGTGETLTSETGAWAWLRMISGRLKATAQPEEFLLTLSSGGYRASFKLRAASVENPFNLTMFGNFKCPQGF